MLLRGASDVDVQDRLVTVGYNTDTVASMIKAARAKIVEYEQIDADQGKYVESANAALRDAHHLGARWWHYSVGHHHLELLIGESNKDNNIVIAVSACESIAGPVSWPNQEIQVHWQNNRSSNGSWDFVLRDTNVGFEVRAKTFLWNRNHDVSKSQHWY